MKRITLKIGLTMALLIITGGMYSQTVTNNTIRLISSSGGSSDAVFSEVNNVTINSSGLVTGNAKFVSNVVATSGLRTGTVTFTGARSKTIPMTFKTASVINQTTPGASDYGSITTPGGIQRAAAGDIGVGVAITGSNPTTGIDMGEGVTFGFDLTDVPSTITLQITKIYYTIFAAATESATIVNRQDPTKSMSFTGSTTVKDVSALGMFLTGGTGYTEMLSTFNSSTSANNWRVKEIEYKLINNASTWSGAAWSNGIPSLDTDTTIEGSYSALTSGSFSCKKLTITAGSLVIEDTKAVRVANEIVNNAGNTGIVVESGGFLRQDNASSVNSGAITVKRNSNSLKRGDYTLWSTPVTGQTLATFSPLTSQSPTNRFYVYNHALGTNGLFDNIAPSSTFETGKGYLIRMPNEDPLELGISSAYYLGGAAITYNGEFIGVPNNGTVTLGSLVSNEFYSVGNPYPATLSADAFINGNATDGTLYFWRKTNGTGGTAYATYTLLGGVGTGPGSGGLGNPTGTIAVGQGFIVKTGASANELSFTNTMRTFAATTFFKTKAVTTKDRVWLNLTNAAGAFSQTLVGYMDGATVGIDNGIDGEYFNDSPIALTSNINNKEYTVQGRPTFDASDVVALNFKTDAAGDYSIALGNFDGVFATGQDVYLVDSKTGADTDLKAGAYSFTAEAGVDNSRFSLKYQKTLKVIDSEFYENNIAVYNTNGSLFVKSNASTINTVKIFDVQGRLIAEQKNVKSNTATFSNLKANQALIVQVSSDDNKVASKKVVN